MNLMPLRRLAGAVTALFLWPVLAIADDAFDIARVAPTKAAIVVTIPNFSKLRSSFDGSELGKLWREPGVQDLIEELSADTSKQLGEFLKGLGAETQDLRPPTGAVGLAVYMPPRTKEDHAHAAKAPHLLLGAEAGENAAAWKDLIDKLVDKGVKDKELTSEEDTIAGVKATVLKPIYKAAEPKAPAKDPKAEDSDEDDDGPLEPEQNGFAGFVGGDAEHPGSMTIAWMGTTLLAATDTKALEHAIDAMQGKDSDTLAADSDFKAAVAQQPTDSQAAVYVNVGLMLTQSFEDMLAQNGEEGGPDPAKLMQTLGLSDVKYLSAGMRMDTAEANAELSMGVLAPQKRGLLALLSEPLGAFDPPAFVPPDAASVTRLSFRFDKVYDLLRQVAASMPDEEGKQMLAGLDQSVNLVKPGVDALGPGVWFVGTYKQPLEHDSAMTLVAIDVKDQAVVGNTLTFFAGQAQGMAESREFEGNTIYTIELMKMSVGLGFNRLFIGPTPAVENALRLAGRSDAPRIGGERGFKDATSAFGPDEIMQSFSDTAQTMRWMLWSAQNADKVAAAQIEESGMDAEDKERILKNIREHQPKWIQKLPPVETMLRHIGDSAAEIHPTPDGFRGRSLMLKPAAR